MEQEQKFEKSIYFQQFLAEARRQPFMYFEKSSIREVRIECLKTIKERGYIHPDWAESCIDALFDQNDDLKEDALSWYLFAAETDTAIIRAINFALSLREKKEYLNRINSNTLSKFIAGRLLKDHEIRVYPLLPPLHEFIVELLNELKNKGSGNNGYFNSDWYCAERALRIIIAAEDYLFLPRVEELILLHQQGVIKPYGNDPPYQKDQNIAALKATRRFLFKAQKDHILNQKKQ